MTEGATPMNPIQRLKSWWHTDERVESPDAIVPAPDDDADPPDECPMGGDHDVVEVRASTARGVLSRYCRRCREDL